MYIIRSWSYNLMKLLDINRFTMALMSRDERGRLGPWKRDKYGYMDPIQDHPSDREISDEEAAMILFEAQG